MNPIPDEPSMVEVLRAAMDARVALVHTSIPATIVAYDPVTQTASVKPTIDGTILDTVTGAKVPNPALIMSKIPVVWPGGEGGTFSSLLLPGDAGQLIFSERSLDEYLATGLPTNWPVDPRRHNMMDAWFFPGGRATPIPGFAATDGALIASKGAVRMGLSSVAAVNPLAMAAKVDFNFAQILGWLEFHFHLDVNAAPTTVPTAPVPVVLPTESFRVFTDV